METGKTKWFDPEKGFGFIERENGEDLFVHKSNIAETNRDYLKEGETVSFEMEETEKGPAAVRVKAGNGTNGSAEGSSETSPGTSDSDSEREKTSFEELGIKEPVLSGPRNAGFEAPRPVQEKGIPPLLNGEDLVITAPTGTGKTAAFFLPLLQKIVGTTEEHPRGLILAPTRELAQQISDEGKMLSDHLDLKIDRVYGGTDIFNEKKRLEKGVDVVVACPGRLIDLMGRKYISLENVEYFVLDEADRMCDMGFLPQLERIGRWLPKERQNVFCSATIPPEIERLADKMLENPEKVSVGLQAPSKNVSHYVIETKKDEKKKALKNILNSIDLSSVLVFCRMKNTVRRLTRELREDGFEACGLQGDMEQIARKATLDAFRDERFSILVATNVAARGLDVEHIRHVINYDIPEDPDVYTHRIGRTGRAGLTGDAYTLVTPRDRGSLKDIEKTIGYEIKRRTLEEL